MRLQIVLCLAGVGLLGAQAEIRIPRAAAPAIDGRVDEGEWAGAASDKSGGGLQVRLQHDASSLFIGVTSPGSGFVSVCLANGDAVTILHASAALGAVSFTRDGDQWIPAQINFAYGMRNTALNAQAESERRAYFAEHGWIASTARMGDGHNQELKIALKSLTPATRLAVAYYLTSGEGSVMFWPDTMSITDGCSDLQLVRGNVPPRLRFDSRRWAGLQLGK